VLIVTLSTELINCRDIQEVEAKKREAERVRIEEEDREICEQERIKREEAERIKLEQEEQIKCQEDKKQTAVWFITSYINVQLGTRETKD
jgi:glucosyltransferase Lgt1/2/3